ncbi:hypothetical protein TBLA_0B02620 [Henningerozyma blattae CBS 6284]|uniref:AAA+ ATPase domain-containing protein n=1 Tax=Henningerozyma blattae (strain ATCC 34711 / CBS 6284 / DSM 70876 / NBRC 10599 / NRRL Y-10934 / UCD 77-7) TaxID=1071380 RepID=I2GYA2_HENB6|nr:hypothetical protein TBLA_0B02620 [Tetrapisispora blattae CBS 6284]CCH59104.1 hypothetical protein TBLA_0B02620 [Tetrapisispora blattae CBS 6284]
MSLWVDKYRPKSLNELSHNDDLTTLLQSLSSYHKDLPHLLLYGPNGVGKKTRCMSLLQSIFGSNVYRLKIDIRNFTTPSNRKLELNVINSQYHIEITPSDMGNNDRIVIQELLKEIAQMEQVDFQSSSGNGGAASTGLAHRFKCVIINEADCLSRDAQAALRRTMEKYSRNIRLIMISNSLSPIISPIKSRCLLIRCPSPSDEEHLALLKKIVDAENVNVESDDILKKIVKESNNNIRTSVLMLESMALSNEFNLKSTSPIIKPDWLNTIIKLSMKIKKDRSVPCIVECRSIIYDLLAHCIPPKIILQELTFQLLKNYNNSIKVTDENILDIMSISSTFDERLALGNKPIFHLEGFIAKVMLALDN